MTKEKTCEDCIFIEHSNPIEGTNFHRKHYCSKYDRQVYITDIACTGFDDGGVEPKPEVCPKCGYNGTKRENYKKVCPECAQKIYDREFEKHKGERVEVDMEGEQLDHVEEGISNTMCKKCGVKCAKDNFNVCDEFVRLREFIQNEVKRAREDERKIREGK